MLALPAHPRADTSTCLLAPAHRMLEVRCLRHFTCELYNRISHLGTPLVASARSPLSDSDTRQHQQRQQSAIESWTRRPSPGRSVDCLCSVVRCRAVLYAVRPLCAHACTSILCSVAGPGKERSKSFWSVRIILNFRRFYKRKTALDIHRLVPRCTLLVPATRHQPSFRALPTTNLYSVYTTALGYTQYGLRLVPREHL